jgi:hypothetical protein
MRLIGNVACRHDKCIHGFRKPEVGDLGIDERTILKWILENYCIWVWTGFNCRGSNDRVLGT